ncbi:MAG: glycosyltransferase family 2 protein [Nanoarchaeota archaeon]|nr:glycosyltransferase family 2 protein [Nanoarchaeota archaeon]
MEAVTIIYLVLMFVALYMFFFFIILIVRNKNRMFDYPVAKKKYKVTVLAAGLNEEKTIEGTVNAIMNSNYDKKYLEVIVINDGSTDNTSKVVRGLMKKYKNLKFIDRKKNIGKAASLNEGIKMAKGELIAVVDADSFPAKDSIQMQTGYFNDPMVGGVTSAVFLRNKTKFIEKLQVVEYIVLAWTRKLLDFIDSVYVTNGPLSMYRKSILNEVGGFDPNTITEDIDLTWNILNHGYKTKMCLSAFVTTVAPNKFKAWFRQRVRWGIGGLLAIWKYRKSFLKNGMFGFFVIPFVSISILLSVSVFLFAMYLIMRSLFLAYLSSTYSAAADTTWIRLQDLNLNPSILVFFTVVLFTTSFIYTRFILMALGTKEHEWQEIKSLFNRLFYLLAYLGLYPIVWFGSFYRMIRRDYRW